MSKLLFIIFNVKSNKPIFIYFTLIYFKIYDFLLLSTRNQTKITIHQDNNIIRLEL